MPLGEQVTVLQQAMKDWFEVPGESAGGLPALAQAGAHLRRGDLQVFDERRMRPIGSVGGSAGRGEQDPLDQVQVEMQEEGAVEEQVGAGSFLGIAGELAAGAGEVGDALEAQGLTEESGEGVAVAAEDPAVGAGDAGQIGVVVQGQDQGIVEAAGALEYGATAAATAQDRQAKALTGLEIYFGGGGIGAAEHDERAGGFPTAQHLAVRLLGAPFEQGLVQRQICLGQGAGVIQIERGWRHAAERTLPVGGRQWKTSRIDAPRA